MGKKKIKSPRWVVPQGMQPTDMDLRILEWQAKGKLVPTRNLVRTQGQIEGIRKAGALNTAVLDAVAEMVAGRQHARHRPYGI